MRSRNHRSRTSKTTKSWLATRPSGGGERHYLLPDHLRAATRATPTQNLPINKGAGRHQLLSFGQGCPPRGSAWEPERLLSPSASQTPWHQVVDIHTALHPMIDRGDIRQGNRPAAAIFKSPPLLPVIDSPDGGVEKCLHARKIQQKVEAGGSPSR